MTKAFSINKPHQIVTGATNASPIVVTLSSPVHGIANGKTVKIDGVLGNTAANGSFTALNVTATTLELHTNSGVAVGGNGVYTSGGRAFSQNCAFPFPGTMTVDSEPFVTGDANAATKGASMVVSTELEPALTVEVLVGLMARMGEGMPFVRINEIDEADVFIDAALGGGEAGWYFIGPVTHYMAQHKFVLTGTAASTAVITGIHMQYP